MTKSNIKVAARHEKVGERHGLSLPLELEEGAPPYLAQATMGVLTGLFLLLLVWANVAHVRELSVATGEIAPYGSTREAAHFEGGIIEEILVKPGDIVTEGQTLAKLHAESSGGEFARLAARRTTLEIRAERMAAQLEERKPDFSTWNEAWPTQIDEQDSIFDTAITQHEATMASFIAREASSQAEVTKAEAELKAKDDLLGFALEQLAIQDDLIDEGFTSKQTYLQAKSNAASADAAAIVARTQLDQARDSLNAATAERKGAEAEYKGRVAEERASVLAELAEIEKPLMSSQDKSDRLTIRAPVSGIVNDVLVRGGGDVVRPGGVIAEITPTDAEFFAEVRVDPKDIGHVFPGLETDVTITTFDPNRYGKLTGRITHISADSFTDERTGQPFYTAYIALNEQSIGKGSYKRALSPGMQVRAEVVTQSRSMMRYILKPVTRSLDHAFTER